MHYVKTIVTYIKKESDDCFLDCIKVQTCASLHDGLQWSKSVEQAHHNT